MNAGALQGMPAVVPSVSCDELWTVYYDKFDGRNDFTTDFAEQSAADARPAPARSASQLLIQALHDPPDFLSTRRVRRQAKELVVLLLCVRFAAHLDIQVRQVEVRHFALRIRR